MIKLCRYALLAIVAACLINNISAVSTWEDVFKYARLSLVLPLQQWENKLYYIGAYHEASWFDALNFCKNIHMNLASIRSEEENEAVYKFIRQAGNGFDYWIGGTRLIDNRKWIWFPYGEEMDYTKWQPGQPDTAVEKCVQVWKRLEKLLWNDRICDHKLKFICERYDNSYEMPAL